MRPEEFDKTLKRVLESREFDYDPAAWEKAQALLEQRKKRPLLWWWPFFVLTVLLVTAGSWYLWSQRTVSSPSPLAETNAFSTQPEQPTQPVKSGNVEIASVATVEAGKTSTGDSLSQKKKQSQPVRLLTDEMGNTHLSTEAISLPLENTEREDIFLIRLKNKKTSLFSRKEIEKEFLGKPREIVEKPFERPAAPAQQSPDLWLGITLSAGRQKATTERGGLAQNSITTGIFGHWYFTPRLGIQLEPSLSYRNGLSASSMVTDTLFGFGQSVSSHETIVRDALMLYIPAGISWQIHPKHILGAGISYHHYLGSNIREHRANYENNLLVSEESATSKGRLTSLSYATIGWYAAYQFRIHDAFSLGLRYQATPGGNGPLYIPAEPPLRFSLHYHLYRLAP